MTRGAPGPLRALAVWSARIAIVLVGLSCRTAAAAETPADDDDVIEIVEEDGDGGGAEKKSPKSPDDGDEEIVEVVEADGDGHKKKTATPKADAAPAPTSTLMLRGFARATGLGGIETRPHAPENAPLEERVPYERAAMMQQVVALPQPVIAAVEGIASAAGCQLVATCDLAIAGAHAQFCTPGVNIGLFCSTPMVALSRNLSRKHAMEMLLSGDMFDAQQAQRFGLVNRVVEAGGALEAALALAGKIASKSALTVKIGKRAFYEQAEMKLGEAYDYASRVMVENLLARDADEGISAFVQKRPPSWEDR